MNLNKRTCKLLSVLMMLLMVFSISLPAYAATIPYSGIDISSGHTCAVSIVNDPDGKIYVADYMSNCIIKMDTNGQNKETVITGLNGPVGMFFDSSGDDLYVAEFYAKRVSKIDSAGNFTVVKGSLSGFVSGIVIDSKENIFAVDYQYGNIYKMDKDGNNFSEFVTGLQGFSLVGMTIDENDNLYVANRDYSKILKITPDAQVSDFITGVSNPNWVTLGDDGFFYVSTGNNLIKKADSTGTVVAEFSTGTFVPWGTYIDEGGYIYFCAYESSVRKMVGSASTQNSTQISLTTNTSLSGTKADPSAFTLTGIASNPSVINAEISGETIILTLDAPMVPTDTNIKVSYTKTATNDLSTSASSFKLGDFNELVVENNRSLYQAAPTGLTGVAPTSALNDGKITDTTSEMEYKLASDGDSLYSPCTEGETTGLTAGIYSVRFAAKSDYYAGTPATVTINAYSSGSTSSSRRSSTASTTNSADKIVSINGNEEKVCTETKTTVNGVTEIKLRVDATLLSEKIEAILKNKTDSAPNLIELSVSSGESSTVALTGDIVKQLEKSAFNISINKDKVTYVISASEITINQLANILGVGSNNLKDIEIEIKMKEVSAEVLAKYNEIASKQEHIFVVPPVEFEIVAKATGTDGVTRETTVREFSNYVERIIEIPENVDLSKITTGVVFNADGTYSHVPTVVYQKDGKNYVKLSSLTNSAYSVIYNPTNVPSVKGHWAEKTINDMASRIVLTDYTNFNADEAVTRAEFADYIIRALGLYRKDDTAESTFTDVAGDSEYQVSIQKSSEWGIISGYPEGIFKPDAIVTRQEAMAMYARAMDIANITENDANKLSQYTDNGDVSSWAKAYVKRAVNAEIFNGKGDGVLDPKGTLTQAEALTAVRNLLLKSELINE